MLRYEGEGTDTGGGLDVGDVFSSPFLPSPPYPPGTLSGLFTMPGAVRNPLTLSDGFPTQFSWGYRIAARADYNSAFGTPITLSPRIAFNHDVNGTTPGPGGNFLEGRKSGTVGVEANYLKSWCSTSATPPSWVAGSSTRSPTAISLHSPSSIRSEPNREGRR